MNNIMKKCRNVIGTIIFVCAAAVIVSYGIMLCLSIKPAVIISGSMEPAIKTGSLAFIDTKHKDAVERDIIAFRTGNIYVTHRVKQVTNAGYITKGDANDTADPGVLDKTDVVGRVVMWIPYVGYTIKFMTSLPVIIVCIMLIIISILLQVARGKGDTDEKNKHADGSCSTAS